MSEPKKGSWIVRMKVTGTHIVTCDNCTEDEARENPYLYAVDEQDVETSDWEIISVEENK